MKKNNNKVSFIVPIYNVEKYVEKCVRSLIAQDYENIEIILVDDGSKDNSANIIDSLSKDDNRIIVIHKENGGVSSARNVGLKKSSGKYILFIDGDDYIDTSYASYFVDLIENESCEMAFNLNCYNVYSPYQVSKIKNYSIPVEKAIIGIYDGTINVAVWNKIYLRDFLINNNLFFNEDIWYGEGMLFNIECLQHVSKVALGNYKVYHQVYNLDSAMRNFNIKSNYCGIQSLILQRKKWTIINNDIINSWSYHKWKFNCSIIIGIVKTNQKLIYKEDLRKCRFNLIRELGVPLKANTSIKRKIYDILFSLFPIFIAKISIYREKRKALLNSNII